FSEFVEKLGMFFFFQAEDGIRDFHVTGVQTCALPISSLNAPTATRLAVSKMRVPGPIRAATLARPLASAALRRPSGERSTMGARSEERRVGKEGRTRRTQESGIVVGTHEGWSVR